jgi:hypothetical protein
MFLVVTTIILIIILYFIIIHKNYEHFFITNISTEELVRNPPSEEELRLIDDTYDVNLDSENYIMDSYKNMSKSSLIRSNDYQYVYGNPLVNYYRNIIFDDATNNYILNTHYNDTNIIIPNNEVINNINKKYYSFKKEYDKIDENEKKINFDTSDNTKKSMRTTVYEWHGLNPDTLPYR